MVNKTILDAVNVIKAELKANHGVESNITINVFGHRQAEFLGESKAEKIVREVAGASVSGAGSGYNWFSDDENEDFDFNVFYDILPFDDYGNFNPDGGADNVSIHEAI